MRIAISALLGMTLTLSSASALAQPAPAPPAPQPEPLPPAAGAQPAPAAQPEAPPPLPPPAAAQPEAPPPPPQPGAPDAAPPPPPAPVFSGAGEAAPVTEQKPLAGWHGGFFLRDPNDYFRIYPKGRINLDFYSFFGRGVSDVKAADGGNALAPRFFVRRARIGFGGEFLKRWGFEMEAEFGGQAITNPNGKTQTSASKAGEDPTADTARFAAVQTPSSSVTLADVWINYGIMPEVNLMFGQFFGPFSMENTTSDNYTSMMERNIAIRGFAFPNNREIGLMAWGEIADKMLVYGLAVVQGDGPNRPGIDAKPDFIGRVFLRPFSSDKKGLLAKAHVGVSAQHGDRDQDYVGYDYAQIRTGQAYTLWDPIYTDDSGRRMHIIPSGSQNAIGGELRLPIKIVELRAELYYVANDTREAVEGYQLTNTERLGAVRGLGWYVQLSSWPIGDAFISGDPGTSPRPTRIDLSKPQDKPKKGLEVVGLIAGVGATYDGAARNGGYDVKTPGADGVPTDINIIQVGVAANYWHTKNVRATVSYNAYMTPGSGTNENLARVPGNTLKEPIADAEAIHELGTRLAVSF